MYICLAVGNDRRQIAELIAEAFECDYSVLTKNMRNNDNKNRAMRCDKNAYMKHFGWVFGRVALWNLKKEFITPFHFLDDTCYVEFCTVKKDYRRKRIFTAL